MRIKVQLIVLEATPIFTLRTGKLESSYHTFWFLILCYQVQFNIVEAGAGTEKMLMHIGEFKWFAILPNLLAGISIWLASWGNSQWSLLNPLGNIIANLKGAQKLFQFSTYLLATTHC